MSVATGSDDVVSFLSSISTVTSTGPAVLSFTMALPLRRAARYAAWGMNGINAIVGIGTVALGIMVMVDSADAAAAWLPLS